ncbi:MAG: 2-amino-4-hydroxy-6-hydroxymethyldihydropteridine diphosphokinase [candidate division Zixibacteria bacterium RBG_16_43_9]|nr:MAG: 2-amino-4-hydroxy-6-hydroxymethyldihydropteridine diphosphokinase [candidate division Zixibacteria bacterium RBG_16_43_9]
MVRAFIGVGSNINPAENVKNAIRLLSKKVNILGISTVYQTQPEGGLKQPPYYNCVVEIETKASPEELKNRVLRKIEKDLGRKRSRDKYASRTIDLDLILYDDLELKKDDFTLPDPQIASRPYLAIPLYELNPDLVLPGSDLRIKKLALNLSREGMQPLYNYTELLKKEIIDGQKN